MENEIPLIKMPTKRRWGISKQKYREDLGTTVYYIEGRAEKKMCFKKLSITNIVEQHVDHGTMNVQSCILLPSLESKMCLLTTSQGLTDFLNRGSRIQFSFLHNLFS